MTLFVIGGSGSGKSSYAEERACLLAEENIQKYYLATMRVFDLEGRRKVEKHRAMRNDKGFITIEQTNKIEDALVKMKTGKKIVLLECISNLTANEMFSERRREPEDVAEDIIRGIECLEKETTHLVIVSNNVFEDGIVYSAETTDYILAMGRINCALACRADSAVEIVAGIPLFIKQ